MPEILSDKADVQNQMPTPYSKSARLKIANARNHFNKLQQEYKSFIEREPFKINKEEDPKTGNINYRVSIRELVPEEWSCIIGDVVHNLRSALDHLAWQSVIVNGETPDFKTEFPFVRDQNNLSEALEKKLKGASPRAKGLISDLRPYPDGNNLLWSLHQLDISDKHKILLPVGAASKAVQIEHVMKVPGLSEPVKFPAISIKPADRQFPLSDGTIIFCVKKEARQAEAFENTKFEFELVFGEDQVINNQSAIEVLSNMGKYITEVTDKFDRLVFS